MVINLHFTCKEKEDFLKSKGYTDRQIIFLKSGPGDFTYTFERLMRQEIKKKLLG